MRGRIRGIDSKGVWLAGMRGSRGSVAIDRHAVDHFWAASHLGG